MKWFFLFVLCSCSLFKTQKSLDIKEADKLVDSVQMTGEGKGRLSIGQNQYVFSVDSVLNETNDWILAVTIPLHGEEVMILKNIKDPKTQEDELDSFEQRIESELRRLNINMTAEDFLKDMRGLVRFVLSSKLGEKRSCVAQQSDMQCEFARDKFLLSVKKNAFHIEKITKKSTHVKLVAENLTGPIFTKTTITLSAEKAKNASAKSPLELELFW